MAVLFLIFLASVFSLAGLFDVHPIEVFGPPTASTPEVKPDWYFLWIYGILEMIPSSWHFTFFGGNFGPEFFGGILVPGILILAATLLPFADRSRTKLRYAELPIRHPLRTGFTIGLLCFFALAMMAGYHGSLHISITLLRWLLLALPPIVTLFCYLLLRKFGYRNPA